MQFICNLILFAQRSHRLERRALFVVRRPRRRRRRLRRSVLVLRAEPGHGTGRAHGGVLGGGGGARARYLLPGMAHSKTVALTVSFINH